MSYGMKVPNNLGFIINNSHFTGKRKPSALQNMNTNKPQVALPQWLIRKETTK